MENTNTSQQSLVVELQRPQSPFSEQTYLIIVVSLKICATGIFAVFGMFSNIINIVVFYRQGILSNSSTVSLTMLAVTDCISCFLSIWSIICDCLLIFVDTSTWRWDVKHVRIFFASRPIPLFTMMTCLITAFAAFERVISVTFPFKVKSIFTPKRSLVATLSTFLVMCIIHIPMAFDFLPMWVMNPATNETRLKWGIKVHVIIDVFDIVYFYISPVFLKIASIVTVVLCNVVIFWKVNLSRNFRKGSAHVTKITAKTEESHENCNSKKMELEINDSSSKEMKLMRMITVISCIFTVCYLPNMVYIILYYIVWTAHVDYHFDVDHVAFVIANFFQTINGSTNIIIYYTMSTRFREEILLCFKNKNNIKP